VTGFPNISSRFRNEGIFKSLTICDHNDMCILIRSGPELTFLHASLWNNSIINSFNTKVLEDSESKSDIFNNQMGDEYLSPAKHFQYWVNSVFSTVCHLDMKGNLVIV
jgi:hypothetical protein